MIFLLPIFDILPKHQIFHSPGEVVFLNQCDGKRIKCWDSSFDVCRCFHNGQIKLIPSYSKDLTCLFRFSAKVPPLQSEIAEDHKLDKRIFKIKLGKNNDSLYYTVMCAGVIVLLLPHPPIVCLIVHVITCKILGTYTSYLVLICKKSCFTFYPKFHIFFKLLVWL